VKPRKTSARLMPLGSHRSERDTGWIIAQELDGTHWQNLETILARVLLMHSPRLIVGEIVVVPGYRSCLEPDDDRLPRRGHIVPGTLQPRGSQSAFQSL